MTGVLSQEFEYRSDLPSSVQLEVGPSLERLLTQYAPPPATVIELGCGNGATASRLTDLGYVVTGVDASDTGIALARRAVPAGRFSARSVYDPLHKELGTFDLAVSLDVIEHLYDPRLFARRAFELLRPGGHLMLSTPYHSYFKNLALAVTGKMESHFTALWDGGHIKFFSVDTLSAVLQEQGFRIERIARVGRVPPLAKWMLVVASKPVGVSPGL